MAAILITILIKPSIAFIINAAIAVLLGVMTNGQFGVVAALFSGMLAIYMSNKSQQRVPGLDRDAYKCQQYVNDNGI